MKRITIVGTLAATLLFAACRPAPSSTPAAIPAATPAREATPSPYGTFTVATSTDDVTRETSTFGYTTSLSEELSHDVTLFLTCDGKNLRVWYNFKRKLVSGRYGIFTVYRFDNERAKSDILKTVGDHLPDGVYLPTNEVTRRNGGTLVIRVRDDVDDETVTATFDLTGIQKAIAALPCRAKK